MKDNIEYAYVMDYSIGEIFEIELTKEDKNLETEEILDKYGFNLDECYLMFSTKKLRINKI